MRVAEVRSREGVRLQREGRQGFFDNLGWHYDDGLYNRLRRGDDHRGNFGLRFSGFNWTEDPREAVNESAIRLGRQFCLQRDAFIDLPAEPATDDEDGEENTDDP